MATTLQSTLFEPVQHAGLYLGERAAAPVAATPPHEIDSNLPYAQQFAEWVAKVGGNWVMERVHARAAKFYSEYQASGQRCSIRLIWELVRHYDLKPIRERHPELTKHEGYAMNDHFHAHAERHVVARHPEMQGMFEEREVKA